MIASVGMMVRYVPGRADGVLPEDMVGEIREIVRTAQMSKRCRVVTPTGGSALIEEFRLEEVKVILG